jgi:hypothetical protein
MYGYRNKKIVADAVLEKEYVISLVPERRFLLIGN